MAVDEVVSIIIIRVTVLLFTVYVGHCACLVWN